MALGLCLLFLFVEMYRRHRGGIFKRNVDLVYRIITPTTHTKFSFAQSIAFHYLPHIFTFCMNFSKISMQ